MKRRRPTRNSTRYGRTRRRTGNRIPGVGILAIGAIATLWILSLVARSLFGTSTEALSATVDLQQGRAEFQLKDQIVWTNLPQSQIQLYPGDSIRTKANTRIKLDLVGGSTLFIGGNSQLTLETSEKNTKSEKKTVEVFLKNGEVWGRLPDDVFRVEDKSVFAVNTDVARFETYTSVFDIEIEESDHTVRVLNGSGKASLTLSGYQDVSRDLSQGQQITLSEVNAGVLRDGAQLSDSIDESFEESEWHLENLEPFDPQAVAEIRRKIELKAPKIIDSADDLNVSSDIESPTIESIKDGDTLTETADDVIIIEGTVPEGMRQVLVNGFSLTQYQSGSRKWVYNAAAKFGTLKNGENELEVYAVDAEGNRSPSAKIKFMYEGAKDTTVLTPDAAPAVSNADGTPVEDVTDDAILKLPAPEITTPPIPDPSIPYETSSDVVTISGVVPSETIAVRVNGFQLRLFRPGSGKFKYTANARITNGNMSVGENKYIIEAVGADGAVGSTEITIVYTPVSIPGTSGDDGSPEFNIEGNPQDGPKSLQYGS